MSAAEILRLTYEQFLDLLEDPTAEKCEYWDGFIVSMAGGSIRHAFLGTQIIGELRTALGNGPCRVFGPDLKLRVSAVNGGFFADASVVCGEVQTAPDDNKGVINPVLVVEVISPSSDKYDRGSKWHAYSNLASLKAYLLVDSVSGTVELLEKVSSTVWKSTKRTRTNSVLSEPTLPISSLEIALNLEAVFEGFDTLPL
jgi:Uma2 family endonuclease